MVMMAGGFEQQSIGGRIGACYGRVVKVKGGEAFKVFDSEVEIGPFEQDDGSL